MHKCCHPELACVVLSRSAARQVDDSLRQSGSHTEPLDALDPIKMESECPTHILTCFGSFLVFFFRSCCFVVFSSLRSLRRPSVFRVCVLIACRYLTGHVEESQRQRLSVKIQGFFEAAAAKSKRQQQTVQ